MRQTQGNKQKRIAKALGASRVIKIAGQKAKGPLGWLWLAQAVQDRLISRGGRPSDPSWDTKRLVPFSRHTWRQLADEAKAISVRGRKVGPAQLAAILIEGRLVAPEVVKRAEIIHINISATGLELQRTAGSVEGGQFEPASLHLSLSAYHAIPPVGSHSSGSDDLAQSVSIGVQE